MCQWWKSFRIQRFTSHRLALHTVLVCLLMSLMCCLFCLVSAFFFRHGNRWYGTMAMCVAKTLWASPKKQSVVRWRVLLISNFIPFIYQINQIRVIISSTDWFDCFFQSYCVPCTEQHRISYFRVPLRVWILSKSRGMPNK